MGIKKRKYENYKEYLRHQSQKLNIGIRRKIKKFMPDHFDGNVRSFEKRVNGFKKYIKEGKILCLGARTGAEVVAFRNLGFSETVGIDINPGKNNKYVIKGDFHNMDFEDGVFDTIYCNCIDHAWNLSSLSKEIHRVLKNDAYLVLEIDHLLKKDKNERKKLLNKNSKYESIMWDDFDDIKDGFKEFYLEKKFVSIYNIFLVAIFKKNVLKTKEKNEV
jgi:SAM-dependent methyltransferase